MLMLLLLLLGGLVCLPTRPETPMYVAAVVVVAALMLDPSDQILLVSESFTAVHRLDAKRLLQAKPSNTDMLPKQG
jgi:hypothetical protein